MSIRVLVTVSRTWSDWDTMRKALGTVYVEHPDAVLVHGDCPAGDRYAAQIWRRLGGVDEPHPANWRPARGGYNPRAGFERNARMVESNPALVIAFIRNASKGASHTADLAEGAGTPVVRYTQEETP